MHQRWIGSLVVSAVLTPQRFLGADHASLGARSSGRSGGRGQPLDLSDGEVAPSEEIRIDQALPLVPLLVEARNLLEVVVDLEPGHPI